MKEDTIICWFSGGVASAIATKLAINKYEKDYNIRIVRIWIKEEHEDSNRFTKECEDWFGRPIEKIWNEKYDGSIVKVFEAKKFLKSPVGAPCTTALKREVREKFIDGLERSGVRVAFQVFGFTVEEKRRHDRLFNNLDMDIVSLLIDNNLTKSDCFALLEQTGIKRPAMYDLGFNNNNCIGCVKGGMGYWNMIKKHFPEVFKSTAEFERKIKYSLFDVYLDELPTNAGKHDKPVTGCSLWCDRDIVK